jgi:hypothetical protein
VEASNRDVPERKEATVELLVLTIGLVTLGLLAMRFGYDSRPGFGTAERGMDAFGTAWTDPIYDQELARETREVRLRRLAPDEVIISKFRQTEGDFVQAA